MPRNGSGTYSLPEPPFVAGTVISSAAVNDDLADIGTALTGSLPRDGQAGMLGQFTATDGSTFTPAISFNNEKTSGFNRVSAGVIGINILGIQVGTMDAQGIHGSPGTVPIGCIMDYPAGPGNGGGGSTVVPTQWLLCFGQAVNRITYAALFAILGTYYGSGDGSTTFNLPDLRGVALIGKNDMGGSASSRINSTYFGNTVNGLGFTGGLQSKSLVTNNLPSYTPSGAVNLSVGATGTAASSFSTINFVANNVAVITPGTGTATTFPLTITNATYTFAGDAQGGTSIAFSLVQPSTTMNKIIYAGA